MQVCISNAQNDCGDVELPWGYLLINNVDGCDKAHTTVIAFFTIVSVQYGEVATDKRASPSLAVVSLWYYHFLFPRNQPLTNIQWQQSPSSSSSPATQSSNGQSPTCNPNSNHAFLSLLNQYPHNNLYQDPSTLPVSSTPSKMPSSLSSQLHNHNRK